MEFNKYQSSEEELNIESYPEEVKEQFYDFLTNVPFIKHLTNPNRLRAKDLPRDKDSKIIVDITKPHILEDMDYFRPAAIHFQKYGCYTKLRPNPNPNSEYGKWIREEVRRCHEGYIRYSDGEWVPGLLYFFLNYWPIAQTKMVKGSKKGKRVIDFPEVWDGIYLRFHYIYQAQFGGLYDPKGGNNGCEISSRGKAHPYTQKVYLPEGNEVVCKSWGEVKIGDTLIGDDGKPTKVINIPFDDYCDVYKVTLKDGREVMASGNHLWRVWRNYSHCYKTMSTIEMMKDFAKKRKISDRNPNGVEYNYKIPTNNGVEWKYKNVPIDPYTLGLCIGDGCFRTPELGNNIYYSSAEEDMFTYKSIIPYEIIKLKTKQGYFIRILDAKNILKSLDLFMKKSEDKFIPDIYKYNSKKVRLNVLRGIMDADGFVDSNGVPIIGVSSKRLADDITFLCRSLGYNCLQSVKKSGYKKNGKYIQCLDSHIVRIYTSDRIFNLERKQSLVSKFESAYSRSNKDFSTIVNIEYSHKEKCKCVTVDNNSNCYLIGDFVTTHNSKSYSMSSIMGKYFILGESKEVNKSVKSMATAYQKQYLTNDGILNKFQFGVDFLVDNTEFPAKRLKNSLQEMSWKMGYIDLDTGTQKGTLNEVMGVSAKDDPSKVRGKRLNFIVVEEFGSFKNVLELYNIMIPSVQEGDISFGTMYLIGTAGDDESDFQGASEIVYNPKGYRMYALPNVFDLEGRGRPNITFFFPGYLSRKGCYDEDGNSNVTKAVLEILEDRYRVKYNSSDINSITKTIAEIPITPQEAILRTKGNMFPISQINDRLNQLDSDLHSYDDVYIGDVMINSRGEAEFKLTGDTPIREFPTKDNKVKGAVEIYQMPKKNNEGRVFNNRYIIGHDPVDDDSAETMSLTSTFVLDLWTDQIVAEYTGRQDYADDNFEKVRALCIFYNAKCLYEKNKKGLFSYFSKMNCTHLLADTPQYLKDMEMVKVSGYGNNAKGVHATAGINNYANDLIRDWLLKPVTKVLKDENGEEYESTIPNLYHLKNRALLKELSLFNPDINVDRIRALGMLMLYREEKIIMFQGDMNNAKKSAASSPNYLGNDPFFKKNWDDKFLKRI